MSRHSKRTHHLLVGEFELSRAWSLLSDSEHAGGSHLLDTAWGYLGTVHTATGWVHVFVHPNHPRAGGKVRYVCVAASDDWKPGPHLRVIEGGLQ